MIKKVHFWAILGKTRVFLKNLPDTFQPCDPLTNEPIPRKRCYPPTHAQALIHRTFWARLWVNKYTIFVFRFVSFLPPTKVTQ